jgi:hypothetical protein
MALIACNILACHTIHPPFLLPSCSLPLPLGIHEMQIRSLPPWCSKPACSKVPCLVCRGPNHHRAALLQPHLVVYRIPMGKGASQDWPTDAPGPPPLRQNGSSGIAEPPPLPCSSPLVVQDSQTPRLPDSQTPREDCPATQTTSHGPRATRSLQGTNSRTPRRPPSARLVPTYLADCLRHPPAPPPVYQCPQICLSVLLFPTLKSLLSFALRSAPVPF